MNYKYIAHFPVIIVQVAGLVRDHYMFKFYIPGESKILRTNEGVMDWLTHNQQFAQKEQEICNSVQYSHPKEDDRIIHKQKKVKKIKWNSTSPYSQVYSPDLSSRDTVEFFCFLGAYNHQEFLLRAEHTVCSLTEKNSQIEVLEIQPSSLSEKIMCNFPSASMTLFPQ